MCASQMRKANYICRIQDEEGYNYNTPQGINKIFQTYFTNLFTTSNPSGKRECLEPMQQLVTEEMNNCLLKEFSITEVQQAVFSMNPISSPGPDGFSARFFQQHWQTVGDEVCEAVTVALNSNSWDSSINETYIVLIPKNKSPTKVTEYRFSLKSSIQIHGLLSSGFNFLSNYQLPSLSVVLGFP